MTNRRRASPAGHERRDCPTQEESTYARAVANVPTVAVDPPPPPPGAVANIPCEVVDLPSDTPLTSTDSDREVERKARRERRRKDPKKKKISVCGILEFFSLYYLNNFLKMTTETIKTTSLFAETAGFAPPITGEEICASLKMVANHIEAVMPKGRNAWEVVFRTEDVATGIEVTGIVLRGRSIELGRRFRGGTWIRVRGLPLETADLTVECIFKNFGSVVSGPHHVMWRGTSIKTMDRTLIPQSFNTLGGKTKITVRYRDQPKTCFSCGGTGHERRDCPTQEENSYAKAVANTPTEAVANIPTEAVAIASTPTDAVSSLDPPLTAEDNPQTSSESDLESKRERERKKKEKERKKMDTSFVFSGDNKRKDVSSPETPTKPTKATHSGLPQKAPTHKLHKT